MWTIAGGIILAVGLLLAGVILLCLTGGFFRWIWDIPSTMRAKRIHAHNALLAKHGLSPYDLSSEQLAARYRGEWIDPKDVKSRNR